MKGCETCERDGHRSHNHSSPTSELCPAALERRRRRQREQKYVYRTTAASMLVEVRREARRRGNR